MSDAKSAVEAAVYGALAAAVSTATVYQDAPDNLSAIRRVNVAIGNVDDDPITAADLRYQFGVTKGAYSILRPELCWQDVDRTIPALVDTKVALVDDEYGFGTAVVQDDPDQQAFLRQIGGVYFLEMTGAERYAIGAPGYFNFAEVTRETLADRTATLKSERAAWTAEIAKAEQLRAAAEKRFQARHLPSLRTSRGQVPRQAIVEALARPQRHPLPLSLRSLRMAALSDGLLRARMAMFQTARSQVVAGF